MSREFCFLSFHVSYRKIHKDWIQTHDFQKGKLRSGLPAEYKGRTRTRFQSLGLGRLCFCSHRAVFINHKILKYAAHSEDQTDLSSHCTPWGNGHLLEPLETEWESNLENEEPKANSCFIWREGKESDQGWDLMEGKRRSQQAPLSLRRTHSSGLTILIFWYPFMWESKRFPQKKKKKKRLKSAWGIRETTLCPNSLVVLGGSLPCLGPRCLIYKTWPSCKEPCLGWLDMSGQHLSPLSNCSTKEDLKIKLSNAPVLTLR